MRGLRLAPRRKLEQSTYVCFPIGQAADSDVTIRSKMHFEIGGERDVADMNLQAKPASFGGGLRGAQASSGCAYNACFESGRSPTAVLLQFTAKLSELLRQGSVQHKPRDRDCPGR